MKSGVLAHLRVAGVMIRHHKVELVGAVAIVVAFTVWAISIEVRLAALHVPPMCIYNTIQSGPPELAGCGGPMAAWSSLMVGEAMPLIGMMFWVPYAVGLLVSVPIVGRELETRTAQTAWFLQPSRVKWLVSTLIPVAVVVGLGLGVLAVTVTVLEQHRTDWGFLGWLDLGLHGGPAFARGAAALGVGTLVGAIAGRTLPAFIAGLVLLLALGAAAGWLGNQWIAAQPQMPIPNDGSAVLTGWRWLTPDHQLVTQAQVDPLVPAEVASQDTGSPQAVHSMEWLEQHGYILQAIGVSDSTAMGWAPYYSTLFLAIAGSSLVGAAVVVDRRRPT